MLFHDELKINFIITGLGMGGAERQVCDLADKLAEKGYPVLLISMTGEKINMPQTGKVEVVILNMVKTPWGFVRAYLQSRRIINNFKPDIVHSHMVHANIFSRLLRLTIKMPKLICTAHSSNEGGLVRMLAYRLTNSLCDINTNVSQEAVDISVKRGATPANRIIAMHNGIDIERFVFDIVSRKKLRDELGLVESIPLILAVGRLTEAKDYPNLLTAFQRIISTGSMAHLVIIGSGEEFINLNSIVAELGLKNRVHFLGLRYDVQQWMSAADVYVMSSAWEGMPLVLLEAMACERVVVATDCGGVKEVVGDAGFLVPPRDSQLLADALVKALSLPMAEKDKLTKLARSRVVERYSIDSVCEKWLSIYQGK
ncbi:glycosyltransferase [Aeromonas caviae]|uniref:glycosyltransferase n=1 Tax=Aeromonas caviae TaxID=648 RepID=UPI003CEF8426